MYHTITHAAMENDSDIGAEELIEQVAEQSLEHLNVDFH